MEVLILDGKSYVKASKAAKELGYATDYVGQLCRSGQVDAHLIGRTWYVNQDELKNHKVEKKRISRVKAREYAKKTIEEHRQTNTKTRNVYTNIAIQYGSDDEPLIPKVEKRLAISAEKPRRSDTLVHEKGDELILENKGEEVIMSGPIHVVDVTDGPIDDDTVILHPSDIVIEEERPVASKKVKMNIEHTVPDTADMLPIARKTFTERLQESNVTIPEATETDESELVNIEDEQHTDETYVPLSPKGQRRDITRTTSALIILIFYILASCTIMLTQTTQYIPNGMNSMDITTTYVFDLKETIDLILVKI